MIQPLFRNILVDPEEGVVQREEATASGILLGKPKEERPELATAKATVLAVGSQVDLIKPGDRVIYNYFSGNSLIEFGTDPTGKEDKEYHLVFEEDVLAKEVE